MTLMITATLSGCSTHSNSDLDESPNSFGKAVLGFVAKTIVDNREYKRCEKRNPSVDCVKKVAKDKSIAERKALNEDLERKEALQQSFDNRYSTIETAEMIEQQRRKNDWIGNSQNEQSVIVIKKDEFE